MGIGSIDYSSLFRNYRVPEIPTADYDRLKKAQETTAESTAVPAQSPAGPTSPSLTIEEPVRKPNADVHSLSMTFNANEDFGYLGSESDIEALDMQKAISDMRKDQVLHQYQYFVGGGQTTVSASEDGAVFLKP